MSEIRGFKPINHLWSEAASTDADSECLYEEISGPSAEDSTSSVCVHPAQTSIAAVHQRNIRRSRKLEQHANRFKRSTTTEASIDQYHHQQQPRHRTQSQQQHALQPSSIGHHLSGGVAGLEARQNQASTLKLTRGRSAAARYLQTTTTTTTTTHYQQPTRVGFGGPPILSGHTTPRIPRHGVRPTIRYHLGPRGSFSNETQEEVQEEDEATLRELLISVGVKQMILNFINSILSTIFIQAICYTCKMH